MVLELRNQILRQLGQKTQAMCIKSNALFSDSLNKEVFYGKDEL